MHIRLPVPIRCLGEHGVGEGDIFIVNDRVKATDKKDAFFIVQLPYLIRRKQLPPEDIIIPGRAALPAPRLPAGFLIDRPLP
jgi:hypothetical protein